MKPTILFLLILTAGLKLFADCGEASFIDRSYGYFYSEDSTIIFIKGVKIGDTLWGMKLNLLENYGEHTLKDTLKVWYCNPGSPFSCEEWDYQETYSAGDTLICILRPTDFYGNLVNCDTCPDYVDSLPVEQEGDYRVLPCSPCILAYSNGMVSGWIFKVGQDTSLAFSDLWDLLMNPPDTTDIADTTDQLLSVAAFALHVCPNPTTDEVRIDWGSEIPEILEIYDMYGRLADKMVIPGSTRTFLYSMQNLPAGSYLFRFRFEKASITKKILKRK